VPLNLFSFLPDIDQLRNPDIDSQVAQNPSFRTKIDTMYVACAPENHPRPEERLANLRRQWAVCQPLVAARLWAIEPLAHVLQQAIGHYVEQQNFLNALCIECFVAQRSDPFKHVAPFSPWRLKGLLMIAKTLANIGMPSEKGSSSVDPGIVALLEKTDEGSLYQAILVMLDVLGPKGHSEEWEILATARGMLRDVECLESRQGPTDLLRRWASGSHDEMAQRFFREQVLAAVTGLADFAIAILKRDLES
jgi:hypothetical protein